MAENSVKDHQTRERRGIVCSWNRDKRHFKNAINSQIPIRKTERNYLYSLEWNIRNQTKITTAIGELKNLINDRNLSLNETEKFRVGVTEE